MTNWGVNMTMQMKFSPEVIAIFNDERYDHPVPLVQRRMEALWLKSHNLPHAQIAELVGICENTLRDYFKLYLDNGVDALRTVRFHRPQSKLCAYAPGARPPQKYSNLYFALFE